MKRDGTVVYADGNTVRIKVKRDSACGENCAACGLCANREQTVELHSTQNLKVGDRVCLTASDKSFLRRSAAGYLLLTACLIAGAACGYAVWKSEIASVLGAAFMTGAAVLILKRLFRRDIEIKVEKL